MLVTRMSVYIAQVFINIVFAGGWWDHQWPDSAHILINYGEKFSFYVLLVYGVVSWSVTTILNKDLPYFVI
jgi:hypothetical protein